MLASKSNSVIEVTNSDVEVTANDVEIPMLRSGNVDESTTGLTSGLRTQISLNVVTNL
jgi:hypothetical protein